MNSGMGEDTGNRFHGLQHDQPATQKLTVHIKTFRCVITGKSNLSVQEPYGWTDRFEQPKQETLLFKMQLFGLTKKR